MDSPFVVVLGIAQDAGFPQAGCRNPCCARAWFDGRVRRYVSCLAIVDPTSNQRWLLDCTPDFREQLHALDEIAAPHGTPGVDGIFLTHAHFGHYAGLMHLGREAIGARDVLVHAMPRMRQFLEDNGPWNQLVTCGNIEIRSLTGGESASLNHRIRLTPFIVPHRVEHSETVGFRVEGPERSTIYLPDIDDWDRWETRIEDIVAATDLAYLDGTFYAEGEVLGRNMAEIPHPLITESIKRFSVLPQNERDKVRFLHLNHTNPVLDPTSKGAQEVVAAGHRIALQGERFEL